MSKKKKDLDVDCNMGCIEYIILILFIGNESARKVIDLKECIAVKIYSKTLLSD